VKILIVPSLYITDIESRAFAKIKSISKSLITLNYRSFLININNNMLCTEHYNYESIVDVCGFENVYIFGTYNKEYLEDVPMYSRYPSLHNSKKINKISFNDIVQNIKSFDAIIVGIKTSKKGHLIRELAIKNNVFVALLDYFDHEDMYSSTDIKKNIFRNLRPHYDFNIFFKHDIPLFFDDEIIRPLSPMPIKIDNYPMIKKKLFSEKYLDISFSGRSHSHNNNFRNKFSDKLKNIFLNSYFKFIKSYQKISTINYCNILNDTKIAFTPAGKVWDSTRHAETAVYGCVPLIPIPNCRLTPGILINNENSINFDSKDLLNNKNKLNLILDRINSVLSSRSLFEKLSMNWTNTVLDNLTFFKRSEFIISSIKNKISN
jgi:hypothetical protein